MPEGPECKSYTAQMLIYESGVVDIKPKLYPKSFGYTRFGVRVYTTWCYLGLSSKR